METERIVAPVDLRYAKIIMNTLLQVVVGDDPAVYRTMSLEIYLPLSSLRFIAYWAER